MPNGLRFSRVARTRDLSTHVECAAGYVGCKRELAAAQGHPTLPTESPIFALMVVHIPSAGVLLPRRRSRRLLGLRARSLPTAPLA
jgi:hypothetical protein